MSTLIKFLHLSDIHYMVNADSQAVRRDFIQELKKFDNEIDCVVLTGDFLQQGEYEKERTGNNVIDFIEEVCSSCLKSNYKIAWKEHVFFCPGNHDLNRGASFSDKTNKKNVSRNDILRDVVGESKDVMVKPEDPDYKRLVDDSFELFNTIFSKELCNEDYGEYHIFKQKSDDVVCPCDVFFIGLNTALYAGQEKEKTAIIDDIAKLDGKLSDAKKHFFQNPDEVKEDFDKFVRLYDELINGGVDDKGKLCFISYESRKAIKKEIKPRDLLISPLVIGIFFGHHPLEFLTEKARKEFANFMADSFDDEQHIYLCGHEHKPKVGITDIQLEGTNSETVIELEVGGVFADKAGWNSASFAIYELSIDEPSNELKLNGEIACFSNSISKESGKFLKEKIYGWTYYTLKPQTIKTVVSPTGSTKTTDTINETEKDKFQCSIFDAIFNRDYKMQN